MMSYQATMSSVHMAARFLIIGGIPRLVFEALDFSAASIVLSGAKTLSPEHLKKIALSQGTDGSADAHHSVVHINVNYDFIDDVAEEDEYEDEI